MSEILSKIDEFQKAIHHGVKMSYDEFREFQDFIAKLKKIANGFEGNLSNLIPVFNAKDYDVYMRKSLQYDNHTTVARWLEEVQETIALLSNDVIADNKDNAIVALTHFDIFGDEYTKQVIIYIGLKK